MPRCLLAEGDERLQSSLQRVLSDLSDKSKKSKVKNGASDFLDKKKPHLKQDFLTSIWIF